MTRASCANDSKPKLRADSLADSVAMLMALTAVQPLVSFARGLLFCRWLQPEQLGQWDMALGFLTLLAPLVVLGIPGSLGRYVEYYRQRGKLGRYLALSTATTIVLTLVAIAVLVVSASGFARLIFGTDGAASMIGWMAICLGPLVAFGFITELLNAARLYRVVSLLQLLRSAGFLLLGATALFAWRMSATSVLAAYGLASALSVAVGLYWIRHADWSSAPGVPATSDSIWLKVMPFALWVWMSNNLSNLFEIVDRYMIVHYSGLSSDDALALVGNYHSSRVVPLLIVIFATMLGSILLPHLSHAWETGRRQAVDVQLRLALKLLAFALSAGAAVFLLIAPALFSTLLENKYQAGLAVLPWTLVYCIWFGLAMVAEMYLWIREEARLASVALLLSMLLNVGLAVVLLPRYGLLGAVLACSASKLTLLLLVYGFNRTLGLTGDAAIWLSVALPAALLLGARPALAVYAVVLLWAVASPRWLSAGEKQQLAHVLGGYWDKLLSLVGRRQPAAA